MDSAASSSVSSVSSSSRLIGPLGRYVLYDAIAAGGMATVHLARLHGAAGFSRVVAIKRLHSNYAADPEYVAMFLAEARLAARIKHPNVVSTLDVVAEEGEVFLVMEFVLGESLERLMPKGGERMMPARVAVSLVCGLLEGLHAAHDAKNEQGEPSPIVHRDISPHNVIVGQDGVARLFDFGIAKASDYARDTREGVIKGKAAYMAPEQLLGTVDVRSDIFATGVVLWELLVGRRLHAGRRNDELFLELATKKLPPPPAPSSLRADIPPAVDAVVARATALDPASRFSSAREMTLALEAALTPAPARDVASWLKGTENKRIEELGLLARQVSLDAERTEGSVVGPWPIDPSGGTGSGARSFTALKTGGSLRPSLMQVNGGTGSSSVSVTAPPKRQWVMPAAVGAAVVLLLLLGVRALQHGKASSAVGDTPAASTGEELAPSVSAATTITGVTRDEAQPATEAIPTATTTAAADAEAKQTKPSTPSAPRRSAPVYAAPKAPAPPPATTTVQATPPSPPKTAAPAAKPSCDNPFFIGADGIRQIKPECM